ncbi:WD40 repeat-like protein [Lentinus tigrinus ALCF2SS1-7]|uniref:WD40 repeat-like protein n=1 Tax=Lentinus tigrinus ALCF2SS1-7 TaxID=1328758 RepID=UPI001165FEAE|nr:WD40 repeat-like protein [Lentinus tigrinus ALCF2SS1-7]
MSTRDIVNESYRDEQTIGTPGAGLDGPTNGTRRLRRRQTLNKILDFIEDVSQELAQDGVGELGQDEAMPIPKLDLRDDHDLGTVDEQLQYAVFREFQKKVMDLDKELRNFAGATRQLGSSVGILSSAHNLRMRLSGILRLFRENAAQLYPSITLRDAPEIEKRPTTSKRDKSWYRRAPWLNDILPAVDTLGPEDFPDQLVYLARDFNTLLEYTNDFPESVDDRLNAAISLLDDDLKYWASCLRTYKGQFRTPFVRRYLHSISSQLGEQFCQVASTLAFFTKTGVPTILLAQRHASQNLLNMSTVAAILSAVTATTLQFSYTRTDVKSVVLTDAVNACWFTSLVFSIGAAANSWLAVTWKQAMYRSPRHRLPWLVRTWINQASLVFLVASVLCFTLGLVLFAYSSGQAAFTCILTTAFSAVSTFGLAFVTIWFAFEHRTFSKYHGTKWLSDVLSEGVSWFTSKLIQKARTTFKVIFKATMCMQPNISAPASAHRSTGSANSAREPRNTGTADVESNLVRDESELRSSLPIVASPLPRRAFWDGNAHRIATTPVGTPAPNDTNGWLPSVVPLTDSPGVSLRFKRPMSPLLRRHYPTPRQDTLSSDPLRDKALVPSGDQVKTAMHAQLLTLHSAHSFTSHTSMVKHLQFSPDGRFLASSSADKTSVIYRIGETHEVHRKLEHQTGIAPSQVSWSPKSDMLLSRSGNIVKVWRIRGDHKQIIERPTSMQTISWLPHHDGQSFLSVEGSSVYEIFLDGDVRELYRFDGLLLRDASMSVFLHLLCIGVRQDSPEDPHPSNHARVEKQIILYSMIHKRVEHRVPILEDIRNVSLDKSGQHALINYSDETPPQLWSIERASPESSNNPSAQLVLRHTFIPRGHTKFSGVSCFGGKDDMLVLCTATAGDVYIWDRDTPRLLHYIPPRFMNNDIRCVAWNTSSEALMFATGMHDGSVTIWKPRPPDDGDLQQSIPKSG